MTQLEGARVLVTGASGFIGARLCQRLLDAGAEVHATWRSRLPDPGLPVRWTQLDLADAAAVQTAFEAIRPDVVVHLAGWVTGARGLDAVIPALHDTLTTTVHVLTSSASVGVRRVLLAGSMEEPPVGAPPSSPYSAAKAAGHVYADLFAALYELPVVHLRIFMVYGPGQHDLNKVIPSVALSLLRGDDAPLSSGRRRVDWIYVDDVVDGMVAAAQAPLRPGETVDLGTGDLVSIADVAGTIADVVGGAGQLRLGALPDRPLEEEPVADLARSRTLLGWEPVVGLRPGIEATVAWCRSLLQTGALS